PGGPPGGCVRRTGVLPDSFTAVDSSAPDGGSAARGCAGTGGEGPGGGVELRSNGRRPNIRVVPRLPTATTDGPPQDQPCAPPHPHARNVRGVGDRVGRAR